MKISSTQMALTAAASRVGQPRVCVQCAYRLGVSQCRPFSAAPASRADLGVQRTPSGMMDRLAKKQPLRSQKSQMKDIKASQVPNDLGLVGDVKLFPPFPSTLRLLTSKPIKFFKLIYLRGKHSIGGFGSLWYTLGGLRTRHKLTGKWEKRPPMLLKQRTRMACDLHKRLNNAIPAGDSDTVHEIACLGLEEKIKARQQIRKQGRLPQESWSLVRYNGITLPKWTPWWIAKLIPFKAATVTRDYAYPIPWNKKSCIRQFIVRIKSRQAYDKGDGKGLQQKDLTEHVVIQQMVLEGQAKEWMIWGTVEPSSIKDIDQLLKVEGGDQKGLSLTEKMKLWMSNKGAAPMGGI